MKWAQTRLDVDIARIVRYDQQFIKGNRIGEEFGIDRWYAVCMWRDDFQKETCCPHSHRSEEAAERWLLGLRNPERSRRLFVVIEEVLQRIEGGYIVSIGSVRNTYVPQIGVHEVEQWRSRVVDAMDEPCLCCREMQPCQDGCRCKRERTLKATG